MLYRSLLLTCSIIVSASCFAQDSLYYVNGNKIAGQIIAIELNNVRYRTNSGSGTIDIVSSKEELVKIRLENGQEFNYGEPEFAEHSSESYQKRRNSIAIDVIAPSLNHVVIGYERAISKNVSLQLKLGFIGILNNSESTYNSNIWGDEGGLGKFGAKFFLPRSRASLKGYNGVLPLSGWYLKPELMASSWSHSYMSYGPGIGPYSRSQYRDLYTSVALNLSFGRQILLGKRISFDVFCGMGYGTRWQNGLSSDNFSNSGQLYAYTHAFFADISPLTVSGGMMFGVVF